mgnify:CR=1 FL=1
MLDSLRKKQPKLTQEEIINLCKNVYSYNDLITKHFWLYLRCKRFNILQEATKHGRGERVVEAAFFGRARTDGHDLGYETIAAAGSHACVLHWIRNDGKVKNGELMLIDAGIEMESYYTADITRTIPINGK